MLNSLFLGTPLLGALSHEALSQHMLRRDTRGSRKRVAPLRLLLIAALAALLPTLAGLAQGEPRGQRHDSEQRQRTTGQRPMREAIGEVEHNYRGHVVDVQSLRQNTTDEDVYRMRVLQRDGRVKTVTVPAKDQRR